MRTSPNQSKPLCPAAAFREFLLARKITRNRWRDVFDGKIPTEDWEELYAFLLDCGLGFPQMAEAEELWKRLQRQRS
jgi:hypothetical protein